MSLRILFALTQSVAFVKKWPMNLDKLQSLLDDQYTWPSIYKFKFVGNDSHREDLTELVGQKPCQERPSKSGKYISYTFNVEISASDEVITIYQKVSKLSGIMSL